MSKIIIIPDTHNQYRVVDKILENQSGKYDSIVFLGDHFDSFGDNPNIVSETAVWLNNMLDRKDVTNIWSNHDIAYGYSSNKFLYCSGFSQDKTRAIFSKLDIFKFREKTKYFHRIGNFIFSHAGVSRTLLEYLQRRGHFENIQYSAEFIENELKKIIIELDKYISVGKSHPILDVSYLRGGSAEVGGLTWADFLEIEPVQNVIQIVGHTPHYPEHLALKLCKQKKNLPHFDRSHIYYPEKDTRNFENLFINGVIVGIDSHLHTFAILDSEASKLSVYKIIFDKKLKESYYDRNILTTELVWERIFT